LSRKLFNGCEFYVSILPYYVCIIYTNLNASCIRNIIWICITFRIWNWNLTSTFINYFSYLVFWGKWHYIKEKQKNRVTCTKTCRSYHSCYRYSGYVTRMITPASFRSEEHTSELQSRFDIVCRLLLEKKNYKSPMGGMTADATVNNKFESNIGAEETDVTK